MKYFFLVCIVLTSFSSRSEKVDIQTLRKKFYSSVEDSKKAKLLLEELSSNKSLDPVTQGYKAAVCMVMANHVFNPYSKFKYFIDGKNELESAISSNPDHIELRLIRFAIQSNVPSFLGYNSMLQVDKQFLILSLSKLVNEKNADKDLINITKRYLSESKFCNATEKQNINKLTLND